MQALFDLEATNSELKQDLRDLYITSAAEIDVGSTRKAIVIHVRLPSAASIPHITQLISSVNDEEPSQQHECSLQTSPYEEACL